MSSVPPAQSDDVYERIVFRRLADGADVAGTVGWREGVDNRVVFTVWDGPSCAARGASLAEATKLALSAIRDEGYVPRIAAMLPVPPADPRACLEPVDADKSLRAPPASGEAAKTGPRRTRPFFWPVGILAAIANLWALDARAEIPRSGEPRAFPNAPYLWRYDGPDFDPSSASDHSAVRLRVQAAQTGATADVDPSVTILDGESGAPVAHYRLDGGVFCDHEDDNCEMDGIFPLVLGSHPAEPVLAVVTHVGTQGQRLSVLRPLTDTAAPVFEAKSDYALDLRPMPGGLLLGLEMLDGTGGIGRVNEMWLAGKGTACAAPEAVPLPDPPPPSAVAAALENELRRIARARDLGALVALLAEDVLVSFGGDGGRQEFLSSLDRDGAEAAFWDTLDRLLAQGGWNGADEPETVTWPWFFAAWPAGDDGNDAYLGGPGLTLRAGPDDRAPVLATLGFGALRFAAPEPDTDAIDWPATGWLPVAAPGFCLGYVREADATPLLGTRMIARREGGRWLIEAFVKGD